MKKKIITCLLVFCTVIVLFNICTSKAVKNVHPEREIKVFTAFFDTAGQEENCGNYRRRV